MSAAALALAAGCGEPASAKRGGDKPRGAEQAREVVLVPVQLRQLGKSLEVSGTLAADEQVTVGAKVAGRLASIAIDLGSVVKRGQAIAQIEATDYQLRVEQAAAALAQARALLGLDPEAGQDDVELEKTALVAEAQATLDEASANLERARSLVEQRLIPQAEFDTAKATALRAQTGLQRARDEIRTRKAALRQRSFELRLARQQLADTVVRAPLDGVVQERNALAGEYLAAGASVALIVRIDPLRLRAEIPEREAPLVRVGQSVRVRVDGVEQAQLGKVVRLAPALREQNRSLVFEAEIQNPGNLRPGSFARAEIVVDDNDAAKVVPASALVSFAGIDKVLTVKDGKAVETLVSTGRKRDEWVEILSGIEAGETVVAEPGNLQQGQPVKVMTSTVSTR